MDEARTAQLMTLFERALAVPLAQRAEFLTRELGDDAELHEELNALLEAHESSADFFDSLAERLISPAYSAVVGATRRARDSAVATQVQTALASSYKILSDLGGGMSRVFLAEEIKLGRKVVIKLLPPEMAASGSAERFRREIQLAAQLQHPHIVPLLTSDSANSFLYYTMPFVAGESLRARLTREGPLLLRDARRIWRDMLDALAHAHASGVIHCDIKPGNVLLSARSALVSDFGIARAVEAAGSGGDSSEGAPFTTGTPMYMAPEQVNGDRTANHRVDIYAAGLVMYEMLEGRLPFSGDTPRDLVMARLTSDPSPITRAECPTELAALVMRCLAKSPDDRPRTAEAILAELEAIPATKAPRSRRIAMYSGAVLTLVAVSLGAKQLMDGRAAAAPQFMSIAVLPFTNLGADSAKASEQGRKVTARWQDVGLLGGMSEDLIMLLSRAGVRVIPSMSVAALRERGLDLRQIAESLRVSRMVDGAIEGDGSRLRLRVRLLDPRSGSVRWSATYDREMREIFAVQEEILRAVARQLGAPLSAGNRSNPASRRYTPSPDAYEWYLRGLDFTLRSTASNNDQAREYFNRAIAADSNFAAAWAGLASTFGSDAGEATGARREARARAEQIARKAVALDDSLAETHVALGWILSLQSDWSGAEAEFNRAIALDPATPRAYEGLARVYELTGPPVKLLAAARSGLAFAPYSHSAIREWTLALMANGRCDEAIEVLKPLKLVSPPPGVAGILLGQCYVAKQMWPEAIAEYRWAMTTTRSKAALAFLGSALARAGQREEATRILDDLISGRKNSHGSFGIAAVYAGFRDFDLAFKWLDKAVDEGTIRVYLMGPVFEEMRRDARFARIKKRMNL